VNGGLAAAGNFLAVASGSAVSAYAVDPASGGLTQTGVATITGGGAIAADAKNVYVAGSIPANNSTGIYGFAVSATGTLTPLAGSPYTFTGACDLCDVPFDLALNNNFLIQGGVGFHGVGDFTVYPRKAGGVLGAAQILGTTAEEAVTIQRPTGSFAYALDTSDFILDEFTIDASGKATPGGEAFPNQPQNLTTDVTGKFLLVLDNSGVVHVFTINPANGATSQIGTSEAAGSGNQGEITLDPSGHFVFVSQASVNQITVFTFDPASGAMKKLQSYPQASAPGPVVVIAR
jgi:6-phosphogluconolactonase